MFFSKFNFLAIKGVAGLHDVRIWSLEGEIDIFAANVVLDDETLEKQSDETKQTIRATLLNHHSEHSTIELESKCQCTGNVCEENNKKKWLREMRQLRALRKSGLELI